MEQKPRDPLDEVRPATVQPPYPSGGQQQGGGLKEIIKLAIFPVLVGLVLMFFIIPGTYVSKADDTANYKGLNDKITALQSSTAGISQLTTQLSTLNAQINDVSNQINSLKNSQGNYASSSALAGLNTSIASIQSDLNSVKNTVSGMPSSIEALQESNGVLFTQVNSLKSQIATVNATLQAGGTTTQTSGTPITGSTSNLSVQLLTNTWTGNTIMNFPSISVNSSSQQQFQFAIANLTSKPANNIQLAIGLQVADVNGILLANGLPSGVSIGITTSGYSTIWISQTTGYPYLYGFTNISNNNNSIFGNLGTLNQPAGTVTYTVTVTIANNGVNSLSTVNIAPIVKVLSYTQ